MKTHRQSVRRALVIELSLVLSVLLAKPSLASGLITKSDLAGAWQITLNGRTGCGIVSMLVNVTINSAGLGANATLTTHGECTDSTLSDQTFQVLSLESNGSGIVSLSCGSDCGWIFNIQVSPDRSIFNLVDVDTANPGNFLGGVAIHQSSTDKKISCTNDHQCGEGFSCWYKIPRGPSAGIPGSNEQPGRCWDNEIIKSLR